MDSNNDAGASMMWGGGGSSAAGSGNGNPYGQNGPGFNSGGGWSNGSGSPYNPMAAAGGAIGAGIGSFFTKNPFDSAQPYYDKIPGMLEGYMQPYTEAGQTGLNNMQYYMDKGQQAGGTLYDQLTGIANDPTAKMTEWGNTFQQSPGYQFQVDQALGAANRASAAGGMVGSPAEQQSIAGTVNQLANQDYYNYLNHANNLYGQGMNGLQNMYGLGAQMGQSLYGISADMAKSLSENLASSYMNQGNLAYAGANAGNQGMMGGLGALGAGIGSLAGMF